MPKLSEKELTKLGLTGPRAEILRQSALNANGRIMYGSTGPMNRLLQQHGYCAYVMSFTEAEIANLHERRDLAINEARRLLCDSSEEEGWLKALGQLSDAANHDRDARRTELRLTEKGWEFTRNHTEA